MSGTPEVICVIFVKRVREGRAEKTMVYVESPMICVTEVRFEDTAHIQTQLR